MTFAKGDSSTVLRGQRSCKPPGISLFVGQGKPCPGLPGQPPLLRCDSSTGPAQQTTTMPTTTPRDNHVTMQLRLRGLRKFKHQMKRATKAANQLRRALRRLRKEKEAAQ